MRILTVGNMYPPHHLGGYELTWRSAVRHLRGSGHQVRVLTTDYRAPHPEPGMPEDEDVHRELRWYWHEHRFPRLSMRETLRLERHNLAVLTRHLRELAPDAVNWWAMGGMSMSLVEAVRRQGIPAVAVVGDDWLLYGPNVDRWNRLARRAGPMLPVIERLSGVPTRLGFDGSARWLFVSETVRRRAREGGWQFARSVVAHPGIDRSLFRQHAPTSWRGRLLCLGRLDPRKGIEVAIRAVERLPDVRLRVVGSGDEAYLRELRSLVDSIGLAERISFERCRRAEVPGALAESDALLFPVLWEEPWGLVPLEAMAVGIPVIATGTGGSGEYLRDGENCLRYGPPEDATVLADTVRRLAADFELRRNLRKGGLATAGRFDEKSYNQAVAAALAEATP